LSLTDNGLFGASDIRFREESTATADSYQQYLDSTEGEINCSGVNTDSTQKDEESLSEISGAGRVPQGVRAESVRSVRSSCGRGMLLERMRASLRVSK